MWNLFVVWFLTAGMVARRKLEFHRMRDFGFFIAARGEKFLWGKGSGRLPSLVRHAYAMVLVVFSWVLFRRRDAHGCGGLLRRHVRRSSGV